MPTPQGADAAPDPIGPPEFAAGWRTDGSDVIAPPSESARTPPPVRRIIEALLFVGGAPLTARRACETIRGLTEQQFVASIDGLNREYRDQGRPYSVQARDFGYVLTLRPAYRAVVERLDGGPREGRLSSAAIDVLALVAYRQPATKQEVDGLRGAESGAILRQLVRRGLIAVAQRGDAHLREVSYGTTSRFLELFGLKSLEDLPQTQDLQRL
jgi:segregation and condensation protein B